MHSKVIILGSGPAGLTAAIYSARANLEPLLVHGPLRGGQLTTTTDVENYPGFAEGVMGPDLMVTMEAQAKRFGTRFEQQIINSVDLSSRPFKLSSASKEYTCDSLILATGASPRLLGLEAESELMGYGVSTCATCDGAFFREKVITVVGGGDSACEEALFLTKFGSKVYLIHRRDELRASKIMADRVLANDKIEVLWDSAVVEVEGDKKEGVTAVRIKNLKTEQERTLEAQAMFVAIGHIPNTSLVKEQLDTDSQGYVITQPDSTVTNVEGVFAAGDVQDHVYRQAVTAAGSGCMAAIEAERWLEH